MNMFTVTTIAQRESFGKWDYPRCFLTASEWCCHVRHTFVTEHLGACAINGRKWLREAGASFCPWMIWRRQSEMWDGRLSSFAAVPFACWDNPWLGAKSGRETQEGPKWHSWRRCFCHSADFTTAEQNVQTDTVWHFLFIFFLVSAVSYSEAGTKTRLPSETVVCKSFKPLLSSLCFASMKSDLYF